MPEPLKNLYDRKLISNLCKQLEAQHKNFDSKSFTRSVFDKDWKQRELKQRMRHITACLNQHLPADYRKAIKVLKPVAANFSGFEYMFFQDYVECYGLNDYETSIDAMEHFTQFASAEFAIRAFILQDEKQTMQQMLHWAKSSNHHVRRLASEGCRPRLPWAVALPAFQKNPAPVLKVLKILVNDDSEYVRRSVANNLNDISKDNPAVITEWARKYLGKNKNTDRLIKHASRTLLKQGDKEVMQLFGYTPAKHIQLKNFRLDKQVRIGEKLNFSFDLQSHRANIGMCRLEFAIDFLKANGSLSRKVFKISEADYNEKNKHIDKYFSFKKITTRKYYPGQHQLTLIINGEDITTKIFHLN